MGLFDFFRKRPFGKINPDDPESYKTAYTEYMQAQSQGDEAVTAFFKRWDVKDDDHWSEIEAKMINLGQGAAAMQHAMGALTAQSYQAAGYGAPAAVEGVGVELYAQLVGQVERLQEPTARAKMLAAFGCDEARFARLQAGFAQLMAPNQPNGAALATQFQQQLELVRRGGY